MLFRSGLLRVGEERRPDAQEVCQADTLSLAILVVILILNQAFQNLLSSDTVFPPCLQEHEPMREVAEVLHRYDEVDAEEAF